jgi:hypothetical protein
MFWHWQEANGAVLLGRGILEERLVAFMRRPMIPLALGVAIFLTLVHIIHVFRLTSFSSLPHSAQQWAVASSFIQDWYDNRLRPAESALLWDGCRPDILRTTLNISWRRPEVATAVF